MNNDKYAEKLIGKPRIVKLSENVFIEIKRIKITINEFEDVILHNNNREIFLGRFGTYFDLLEAEYKDGKIMIYRSKINFQTKEKEITKILTLYEILDDTFYSVTEKEAMELFDQSMNSSFLGKPNESICRSDVEKKQRYEKILK